MRMRQFFILTIPLLTTHFCIIGKRNFRDLLFLERIFLENCTSYYSIHSVCICLVKHIWLSEVILILINIKFAVYSLKLHLLQIDLKCQY